MTVANLNLENVANVVHLSEGSEMNEIKRGTLLANRMYYTALSIITNKNAYNETKLTFYQITIRRAER